ncbi:MAG: PaaI family thioesterase [Pikeienuella sp.]
MSASSTQDEKARRDLALNRLAQSVPYNGFLGVDFQRMGDELTGILSYDWTLIGNPALPALHGGVIGAFLEITAQMQLTWGQVWTQFEDGGETAERIDQGNFPAVPKTIDITVDYLRSGKPRDAYARASVQKLGRRVANVRIEAWQDARSKPIAAAHGHFMLPGADE